MTSQEKMIGCYEAMPFEQEILSLKDNNLDQSIKENADRKSSAFDSSLETSNIKIESNPGSSKMTKSNNKETPLSIKELDSLIYPPIENVHTPEWNFLMDTTFMIIEGVLTFNRVQDKKDKTALSEDLKIFNECQSNLFKEMDYESFIEYIAERIGADENLIVLANLILDKVLGVPEFSLTEENVSM